MGDSEKLCEWCGKRYDINDTTAHNWYRYCSKECEDESKEKDAESSSGGGSLGGMVLKLIGIVVAVWIGWLVLKGCWNGMFHGGKDEVITEAAIMEKWEEHLEKRREAFDDGKPEKEIEAKGLRNYTWDE